MASTDIAKPIFIPMPGRVAVQLEERTRIGSLILPPGAQRSRVMGTIVAIGGDESDGEDYFDLAVGDQVLFGQNSGIMVSVGNESVLILSTREVLCRLNWSDGSGRPRVTTEGEGEIDDGVPAA